MLQDRFGLDLSTESGIAQEDYCEGLDLFLAGQGGVEAAFARALSADPGFTAAHVALARNQQSFGRMAEARAALAAARACDRALTPREAAQLEIFGHLIEGRPAKGYDLIRAHIRDFPRDALVAQTLLGVFSLIGFSGRVGREAEHLAVADYLAPHYAGDWWFPAQLAFAQLELGQFTQAEANVDQALARNRDSAHAAHIRAHLYYELGDTDAGLAFLEDWMSGYDRAGLMHCHNSWHVALWALATGDEARMWRAVDEDLSPAVSQSPAINIVTDLAALYYRAGLAGVEIAPERWRALGDYAAQAFPKPGMGFVDIHAALVHAMSGNSEALSGIVAGAKGPIGDLVVPVAEAFRAIAAGNWAEAEALLIPVVAQSERVGGSRAQRDILEFALLNAQIRQGRAEEARRLLALRRPHIAAPAHLTH
ncbi:tetratricopeptide repeat protein [Nioella sp.]|uniref:tetratricopeptide repeat protein n=1 Tax=Nioella sp. TaxID=1912091 RepID=UPI003512FB10